MRYLLRSELEGRITGLLLLSLGLAATLVFSNLLWAGYFYLQNPPLLTELHLVKNGEEYVELYLSPEDCYTAGQETEKPIYWRCEFQ